MARFARLRAPVDRRRAVVVLAALGAASCGGGPTDPSPGEAPAVTTVALAEGEVGVVYSDALAASGGRPPYSWDLGSGSLPAGLTLAAPNGVISGTPTVAGTAEFEVRVTGGDGLRSTKSLSLAVRSATLAIFGGPLSDGVVDVGYETSLQATGGDGRYEWSVVSGSLPAGLSLTGDVVSGEPTESGYFPIRIQVESEGRTATADERIRVYPTHDLRLFLDPLPSWIASSLEYNEEMLVRNPHLAEEIEAKVELLSDPGLEATILNQSLFERGETGTLDGRSIPLAVVFPADTMRWGARRDFERLAPALAALEGFIGVAWPAEFVREWYGFRLGHSGGGGSLFMEDRGTYADRGVPHDVIVSHELAHSYVGHEGLTQFLEVYAYNVVETGSTEVSDWTWRRSIGGVPYVPFAPDNDGAWALMDVYQLLGPTATGRAYARIHALGAPYGVPLGDAARQAFVDEAPDDARDQVADLALRI